MNRILPKPSKSQCKNRGQQLNKIGIHLQTAVSLYHSRLRMDTDTFLQLRQLHMAEEYVNRRSPIFRDRISFDDLSDEDIRSRYRFGRSSLSQLKEKVERYLPPHTKRNHALTNEQRLMLTLRVLASGSFLEVVGDTFGVDKSTASRAFDEVISAILALKDEYLNTDLMLREDNLQLFESQRFPRACGCIDATHVKILAPKSFEEEFVNRKGMHSINVQLVTTGDLLIANCVARWPGSTHDSKILTESAICEEFRNGKFGDHFLLGDQGYPLKQRLFTPVLERSSGILTTREQSYNKAHRKVRSSIERTIGILKRRWSCLHSGLRFRPSKCCKVIVACAILHNFATLCGESLPEDFDEDTDASEISSPAPSPAVIDGSNCRTMYIHEHF